MESPLEMKQCIDCGETKTLSEYNISHPRGKQSPGFPRQRCKICQNLRQRELRDIRFNKNPEKRVKYLANKRERRMAKYNLTQSEFEVMAKQQGNRCLICKRSRKLHVDHSHETGKVRGLLCSHCNTAIGLIGEDIQVLKRMISYLENS